MLHRQVPTSSVETGHPDIPKVADVLHFDLKPFSRLDPVPSSESAIFDVLTRKPVLFNVLGSDGRKPETVYPHELYPITQPVRLTHAIPGEVWGDEIKFDETMKYWGNLFSGYKRMETKGTYMKAILMDDPDTQWRINGSLDLFGVTNNSLSHVISLARYVTNRKLSSSIILHFITMACMQYYLMERNRFLVVYTSEQDVHRSSMHPYLFLLFPRYDVKRHPCTEALCSVVDSCTWASRYDLTSFIYSVCKCLVSRIRVIGNHLLSDSDIDSWCKNTLFSNLKLFLVTSRFMHVPVADYSKEIRDSIVNHTDMPDQYDRNPLVTDSEPVKSFVAPSRMYLTPIRFSNDVPPYNNIGDVPDQLVRVIHNSLLPLQSKMPVPYCHFFFNPIRPIGIFNDEDLYTVLYELSKYFDKSLSDKVEKELSCSMLPGSKATHYPCEKINMIRVAYSYILRDNQLWTGVGAYLHMNPGIRFHSHASPVDIDEPTWDWICRRAESTKCNVNLEQKQCGPMGSFAEFCVNHIKDGPHDSICNAFLVLHAISSTNGITEEDAIGWMIQNDLLGSNHRECLQKLRVDYAKYLAQVIGESRDLFGETDEGFSNLKALISRARVAWCKNGHHDIPIPCQSEWEDALRPVAPRAGIDRVLDVVRGAWIWRFPVLVAKPAINERSIELFKMQRELPCTTNLLYQLMKDMRAKSFIDEIEKQSKCQNNEQQPLSRILFESLSHLSDGLNKWTGSNSIDDKVCSTLRALSRDHRRGLLINVNKNECKAKCVRVMKAWITLSPHDVEGLINKIVFDEMISCFDAEEIPVILADILTSELNGNEVISFKRYIDRCRDMYQNKQQQGSDKDAHLKTLLGKELCRVGMKRKRGEINQQVQNKARYDTE